MAVDAVVRGIKLALEEPGIVAIQEGASVNSLEVAIPREQLAGVPRPEFLGLGDGFLVEGLVLLKA
jgi:hypothetical protein